MLMDNFGKCIESLTINTVIRKTVSTKIVVSTQQLALLVRTENKNN